MFTVAAERLTLRMRRMAFEAMLRQEIAWFDRPENQTGALCSRLSADASCIANGVSIATMLNRIEILDENKCLPLAVLIILQSLVRLSSFRQMPGKILWKKQQRARKEIQSELIFIEMSVVIKHFEVNFV